MSKDIYAGIDAGGTNFKCIVGTGPDNVLAFEEVAVGAPQETLSACANFFKRVQHEQGSISSLGVASFGPLDLNVSSPGYGCITSTPKPHWSNTDIVGFFKQALNIPVSFDTDVNGALLGELKWGAAQKLQNAVYVTIGTGIGAGVMMDGRIVYGARHTEAGHMLIPKYADDVFHGVCPFHGDCLEGLASGRAIAERWQKAPSDLLDEHLAWELEAHYLAAMCVNLSLLYSPERIILGGGVMQRHSLFPMVRQSYLARINSYLGNQSDGIEHFITAAQLGGRAGAFGALVLAQEIRI